MNKDQFATKVAEEVQQNGFMATKFDAIKFIEAYNTVVKKSLSAGHSAEPIIMRGFGSFELKHRATKQARNITKNTTIIIQEHDVPVFKFSKEFKNSCK
jgi:DNA-binding protein HU-beta